MTLEDIEHLENRLHGLTLPDGPIDLDTGIRITDVPFFVKSHLTKLKHNPTAKTSEPAYDRLLKFVELAELASS